MRRRGPARRAAAWPSWLPWPSCSPVRRSGEVTATAQQIFGGIGFTVEFDIQLYFRRAKQLQLSWWDTRALEERVAAAALD